MSTTTVGATAQTAANAASYVMVSTKTPEDLFVSLAEVLEPYQMKHADLQGVLSILRTVIIPPPNPSGVHPASSTSNAKIRHKRKEEYRIAKQFSSLPRLKAGHGLSSGRQDSFFRPPDSVNRSFYLHHTDDQFAKLLPNVDRSRYTKPVVKKETMEDQDTEIMSRIPTPSEKPAPPPSTSAAPLEVVSPVEEIKDSPKMQEVAVQGSQESQLGHDHTVGSSEVLVDDTAQHTTMTHTPRTVHFAILPENDEDDSGIVIQDTARVNTESFISGTPKMESSNSHNYLLDKPATQDEKEFSDNSLISSVFSQLEEPSTLLTDLSQISQLTDTQPQDLDDTMTSQPPATLKAIPTKLRRSTRLAKASTPPSTPSAPSMNKRKHTRDSDTSTGAPARKKSRTS